MQSNRKSEKRGWTLGWLGGFLWVLILALVSLAKGEFLHAFLGGALVITALGVILLFSPWRFPTQPYWKLMLPLYLLFFSSLAWLVWISGGFAPLGLSGWSFFLLFPVLLPLYLTGGRRWTDGEPKDR